MRDSTLMIMGFLIVVTGWALQIASPIARNIRSSGALLDAGAVFQLAGFISIIVGLSILAIGFFRFTRRVERHIFSHT
ncbi:MAG TPA: hypothetical protein VNA15_12310 [Candidatus Angelobacter sp.]|nr:hypothetical protein [Candidatus Angelobacter sp.]